VRQHRAASGRSAWRIVLSARYNAVSHNNMNQGMTMSGNYKEETLDGVGGLRIFTRSWRPDVLKW
jgi:hypothetical protein